MKEKYIWHIVFALVGAALVALASVASNVNIMDNVNSIECLATLLNVSGLVCLVYSGILGIRLFADFFGKVEKIDSCARSLEHLVKIAESEAKSRFAQRAEEKTSKMSSCTSSISAKRSHLQKIPSFRI